MPVRIEPMSSFNVPSPKGGCSIEAIISLTRGYCGNPSRNTDRLPDVGLSDIRVHGSRRLRNATNHQQRRKQRQPHTDDQLPRHRRPDHLVERWRLWRFFGQVRRGVARFEVWWSMIELLSISLLFEEEKKDQLNYQRLATKLYKKPPQPPHIGTVKCRRCGMLDRNVQALMCRLFYVRAAPGYSIMRLVR